MFAFVIPQINARWKIPIFIDFMPQSWQQAIPKMIVHGRTYDIGTRYENPTIASVGILQIQLPRRKVKRNRPFDIRSTAVSRWKIRDIW